MSILQVAPPNLSKVANGGATLYLMEGLGFSADERMLLVRATFVDDAAPGELRYGVWLYDTQKNAYVSCLNEKINQVTGGASDIDILSATISGTTSDLTIITQSVQRASQPSASLTELKVRGSLYEVKETNILGSVIGADVDIRVERFAMTADARFLAIQTDSALLAPNEQPDENETSDIYVIDLINNQIKRVTAFDDGFGTDKKAVLGNLIATGSTVRVSFVTEGKFATSDKNEESDAPSDIYCWSKSYNNQGFEGVSELQLVSTTTAGLAAGFVNPDQPVQFTNGGLYFSTLAQDLVSRDLNSAEDAFFNPLNNSGNALVRLSGISELTTGSTFLSASTSGRYVAILSHSVEVSSTTGASQLVLIDKETGAWQVISRNASILSNNDAFLGLVSPKAKLVAFTSLADNLVSKEPSALGGSLYIATTGWSENVLPTASNQIVTIKEDGTKVFAINDFGFSDADSADGLLKIKITTLESKGYLKLNGDDVVRNQEINAIDISNGKLVFVPASNGHGNAYATFKFQVSDGVAYSTASGGYTMAINVTPVNDAPTLTKLSMQKTVLEDKQVSISAADIRAAGDEADVDGTVSAFVVKAVSTGSLKIGTTADTATAWHAKTNNLVDATHQAYWTPAANANGSLNAFTILAKDDLGLVSVNPVQVKVQVTPVRDDLILNGTTKNDTLTGDKIDSGSFDRLYGLVGDDKLFGMAGDDILDGGIGNDNLIGGAGKDVMTGGAGNDIFDFNAITEIVTTLGKRDVIKDFKQGQDKIDLSDIDANEATANSNEAFMKAFIASNASFTKAGQLKFASGILYGNTDNDSAAEFAIELVGISSLNGNDIIL